MNFKPCDDRPSNFTQILGSKQPKTGDPQADRFTSLFNVLKCNFCDWRVSYLSERYSDGPIVNPDYLKAVCKMRDHIYNEHCEHFVPQSKEVL